MTAEVQQLWTPPKQDGESMLKVRMQILQAVLAAPELNMADIPKGCEQLFQWVVNGKTE